ncbi:MAG TPA: RIO1 family regulatory kinase/ATPase [Planctomycetota bacterium]|nr:RIO1 family regulatory kinase/ATPase [Planctomycetota bacterium]
MSAPLRPEGSGGQGRVLRDKGGFLSPAVSVVDHDGRPAVLKDYRRKNAVTRGLLAPSLVKREFSVLRHLEGIPGIPRAYAVLEKRAILLEYIEGLTINKFKAGELSDRVYERLVDLVRAMHARGVVHLDLRQRKNILIAGEQPWLIDFANAMKGKLTSKLRSIDESALLKFKQRNWPHLVTDADRDAIKSHKFLRKFWIFSPRGKSAR